MDNHKNLKIWQQSMDLVETIYRETATFPYGEEYGLIGQLRSVSSRIPSNIAEGTSRPSQKEFKDFLYISLGSSYEVSVQIELAKRLSLINSKKADEILTKVDQVEKMIIGFMKSLRL